MTDQPTTEHSGQNDEPLRTWEELRSSGLLWLMNRVVFHPRGFALAVVYRDGEIVGWKLLGDGREPWQFVGDEADEMFARAEATLRPADQYAGEIAKVNDVLREAGIEHPLGAAGVRDLAGFAQRATEGGDR